MADYVLTCCSTADLSAERFAERNIPYVCFNYSLNGKTYKDDMGVTMSPKELYDRMTSGEDAKTSQVSVTDYVEFWEPYIQEGKGVLHICLSSGISGTYNAACIAKDDILEKYPNAQIYVVDSLQASAGFGLEMEYLADMRDEGKSIEELYDWIETNKLNFRAWFFSGDLTFFIKGGRVSKPAGVIGNMLGICPLMEVNYEGKLLVREKIRGKKKAIKRVAEKAMELAENGAEYEGKYIISHSECYEDARAVADLIEAQFPNMKEKVAIYNIGATIGSHTGPGTVATFFYGKKRVD